MSNLPERVKVFPTANYFYFRFTQKASAMPAISGSPRPTATGARRISLISNTPRIGSATRRCHAVLGAEQGVKVEQAEPLLSDHLWGRSVHSRSTICAG